MRKKISYLVLMLLVAVFSGLILSGKMIQNNYYTTVIALNRMPALDVSIINYNRGLLSSDVILKLNNIDVTQKISHGPKIKIQSLLTESKLALTTEVSLDKSAHTTIYMTAESQENDNLHVSWGDVIGKIDHSLDLKYYKGVITMPHIEVGNNKNVLALNNVKALLLNTGNKIHFDSIEYITDGKKELNLAAVMLELKSSANSKRNLDIVLKVDAQTSVVGKQLFSDRNAKLEIKNLKSSDFNKLFAWKNLNPYLLKVSASELRDKGTKINLLLPKDYTEALAAYVTHSIYINSKFGKLDKRPPSEILKNINTSVIQTMKTIVEKQIMTEQNSYYKL